tara:strand:- start:4040 stop:5707 length:1668 start_codon:yes stop_codon:yes gene_type:complete
MSGFFISNSFGKFHSENKEFNAVKLSGFPDAGSSMSGKTIRNEMFDRPYQNKTSILYSNQGDMAGNRLQKYGSGWAHMYEGTWLDHDDNRFFSWTSQDTAVMRDDQSSAIYLRPAPNVRMKVMITFYDCTAGTNYNYTNHELGIPSNLIVKDGHREKVTLWLDGNTPDYIFIDMDDDIKNNTFDEPVRMDGNKLYAVDIRSEEGSWYSHYDPDDDDCSTVAVTILEAVYTKEGCTDSQATNYDSTAGQDDGSCIYSRAIPTISFDKNAIREGEKVKISWNLDTSGNKGYSRVKIYDDAKSTSTPIKTSTSKNSYYRYTPSGVGGHPIRVVVEWDKGGTIRQATKTVQVQTGFIECTDPNRAKDSNGECADCKSQYHLGDDGLCTQCADPNRDMDSDGKCTDCMTGYALGDDGLCQKAGCTDPDDYNYDPEALISDDSLCEGVTDDDDDEDPDALPEDIDCELSDWSDWSAWSDADTESGTRTRTRTVVTAASGNGAVCEHLEEEETKDPDTGEITITTMGGGTTPVKKEEETKSPLPIILAGVVGLGILAVALRR